MRTPILQFVCASLAAVVFGCTSTRTEQSLVSPGAPALVIRQFPDYPVAGHDSLYAGGLIAALWSDGRIIRPTGSNTVGKSYVEGVVNPVDREKFLQFLNNSVALLSEQAGMHGIAVDAAYQTLRVYRDGTRTEWSRPLPDWKTGFQEIEARLRKLPLHAQRPVDWERVWRSSWYD